MKRLREITKKFEKEKIGMKHMSETVSPPLPASHFQGTSPTGRLDLQLISPVLYAFLSVCHPSAFDQ